LPRFLVVAAVAGAVEALVVGVMEDLAPLVLLIVETLVVVIPVVEVPAQAGDK
jgi:hypothetical protein